jgi:FkbM family methyltransferase
MGNFFKTLLGKKLFYSLKYSRLYSIYEKTFKPVNIEILKKEISLYRSFLPLCNLIFDIGANDGHKTAAFLAVSDKVVSCEPDEQSFLLLGVRFRNEKERVVLLNKAVSDKIGQAILHIHHAGSAFNTLNRKWVELLEKEGAHYWDEPIRFQSDQAVELVTIDKLIEQYGKPDFIKIDVEGSEVQVLRGLNQKINWISFESFLPEFKSELLTCVSRLQELDPNTEYNLIAEEKILLENYLTAAQLIDWLENSDLKGFEVLARTR